MHCIAARNVFVGMQQIKHHTPSKIDAHENTASYLDLGIGRELILRFAQRPILRLILAAKEKWSLDDLHGVVHAVRPTTWRWRTLCCPWMRRP